MSQPTAQSDATARLPEVYREIVSRNPEHRFEPTLDRVARVMDYLGDPHRAYRVVHLTGTNGKTSTARMVEALVRAHGLRTGLFTSPHLSSITERIQIDGVPLSADRFCAAWDDVAPYVALVDAESQAAGGPRLSFFEVLAVMAFAVFADAPIEVAILEVGMGGTWDATNVATGDVCLFTPIGLDHQKWLGQTLAEIAETKAGILKAGAVAVSATQPESVAQVLATRARDLGVRLLWQRPDASDQRWTSAEFEHEPEAMGDLAVLRRRLAVGGQVLDLRTPAATYHEIMLPLHGAHQAQNALLALAAVEQLLGAGGALGAEVVEQGFAQVASPGRLELVRTSPPVLVDVAHNPHGAAALAHALAEAFDFARLVAVVAIAADKDAEGILSALEPQVSDVVLTRNSSPRCCDPTDLREIAEEIYGPESVVVVEHLADALQTATDLAEGYDVTGMGTGAGVLVTGSVVTAADARILYRR